MKKIIYTLLISGAVLCSSCNDWLNVTPKGQVEAGELYTTSKGCNSALGGIYYTLTSSSLYGKELSYGAMDMLAQYWDVSKNASHKYYRLAGYEYKDVSAITFFNDTWGNMYQAVTQCNALLHYLPENRDQIAYANLIEGEAYALRAFIHMELFEMFGPVIQTKADLQKKAIAYRTEFDVKSQDFNTGEEVLNFAEKDLKKALELMADDPIQRTDIGRKGDANTSKLDLHEVLRQRGSRVNYFCALGLLARLEQLRKNPDQAYTYALRVMNETKNIIALIDKENNAPNTPLRDYNYSTEMLGALYVNNLYDLTNDMFYMEESTGTSQSSILIDANQYTVLQNEIYGRKPDGAGTDNRLRYWFAKKSETGSASYDFKKLHKADAPQGLGPAYDPEIPIMRMAEIYYIACESNIGKDNTLALKYLNDVRRSRKLEDLERNYTSNEEATSDLKELLIREIRKDMIGEGRFFLTCKRLFCPMYIKAGVIIQPSTAIFTFPIPDDEYEYTNNNKE